MTDGTLLNNVDSSHAYRGDVYCAASGQWAFRVTKDGEEFARGAGFEDEIEASEACSDVVPFVDFPIFLSADPSVVAPSAEVLAGRVESANALLWSLHNHWSLNPHDSMDSEGVLELLSDLFTVLNGVDDE